MAHSIAIIGIGPRGVYALEHLTDVLLKRPLRAPLEVHLIEPSELGVGPVWRAAQPRYLLMNTISSQVTAYGEDEQGPRGPSVYEWMRGNGAAIGPDEYPERADHGLYLGEAIRRVMKRQASIPLLTLRVHPHSAVDVLPERGRHRVVFSDGHGSVLADFVLLLTGHTEHVVPEDSELLQFAQEQSARGFTKTRYLPSVYPVEHHIEPLDETVTLGVLGLGLSAVDALIAATVGRGGSFERRADGELVYHRSGREPRIAAWSRSGLPLAARGVNQKGATGKHVARVFTRQRIDELRAEAVARTGTPHLSFDDDVLPVLIEEMRYAYYAALRGEAFAEAYLATAQAAPAREALLAQVPPEERFDWERLTMPLKRRVFHSKGEFRSFLLDHMRKDIAEARKGNLGSPYKAACDILRDLRGTIRAAYEWGGLTAEGQRRFDRQFWPMHMRIAVGPPLIRIEQMVALAEAGILDLFWGENPMIAPCPERGCFKLTSWSFESEPMYVDVLANGRLPQPNLYTDASPLLRNLRERGVLRQFKNENGAPSYTPCGVEITPTNNVIGADGRVNETLYAMGVLTEGPQLYMPGAASPGATNKFLLEARGWARDVREKLQGLEAGREGPRAAGERHVQHA